MRRLEDFHRLLGFGPTVCSAVGTQNESVSTVCRDRSPRVLIHRVGVSRLWNQTAWCETQSCFLLVASGLLLKLSELPLLHLGSGDVGRMLLFQPGPGSWPVPLLCAAGLLGPLGAAFTTCCYV